MPPAAMPLNPGDADPLVPRSHGGAQAWCARSRRSPAKTPARPRCQRRGRAVHACGPAPRTRVCRVGRRPTLPQPPYPHTSGYPCTAIDHGPRSGSDAGWDLEPEPPQRQEEKRSGRTGSTNAACGCSRGPRPKTPDVGILLGLMVIVRVEAPPHAEVPVKVTAWVDAGVVPLVEALNSLDGVLTLDSCQGYNGGPAQVCFTSRGSVDDLIGLVRYLADLFNAKLDSANVILRLEWQACAEQPVADLLVGSDCLRAVAEVVASAG
jgi:hypothetical protein